MDLTLPKGLQTRTYRGIYSVYLPFTALDHSNRVFAKPSRVCRGFAMAPWVPGAHVGFTEVARVEAADRAACGRMLHWAGPVVP